MLLPIIQSVNQSVQASKTEASQERLDRSESKSEPIKINPKIVSFMFTEFKFHSVHDWGKLLQNESYSEKISAMI